MASEAGFDIAIVGGGLIGASLARALSGGARKIALIEAAAPPAAAPSWDERCIALNPASKLFFESLGVWDELAVSAAPITSTHISERGRFGVARFAAAEAGLDALGYNVPLRALGQVLWRAAQDSGAEIICPGTVDGIEASEGAATLAVHQRPSLTVRLVAAADGAGSPLRRMLGIDAQTRDYQQSAIVTAVRTTRPHRHCAYERFTPEGPIALLPKHVLSSVEGPEDACSLVWTVPTDLAGQMLAWDDARFLAAAQDTFGERLGKFTALGRRVAHPLSRVMSEKLTAPRVVFAGNAAQSLHPVAAQGFNLGLRDVAALRDLLTGAADPGAAHLLQEYASRRMRDREATAGFTDHLVRLFSNRVPGLAGLRHLGLLALDLAPPLKEAVLLQNLGLAGGGRAQ